MPQITIKFTYDGHDYTSEHCGRNKFVVMNQYHDVVVRIEKDVSGEYWIVSDENWDYLDTAHTSQFKTYIQIFTWAVSLTY